MGVEWMIEWNDLSFLRFANDKFFFMLGRAEFLANWEEIELFLIPITNFYEMKKSSQTVLKFLLKYIVYL